MPSLRLSVAVAAAVVAVSCGGKPPPPPPLQGALSSRWSAPSILAHIPADSPYVFAVVEPISDAVRHHVLDSMQRQFTEAMQKLDKLGSGDRSKLAPWIRGFLAFADELRGKPAEQWIDQVGLDPRGLFALYGLSMWPVMRVEIANAAKLRAVIERIRAATGIEVQQRNLEGHPYWLVTRSDFSFIAAVLDREAVAAVMPSAVVDAALPQVLGLRPPERSLASTGTVPELLARHHFTGNLVGYLDAHNIVDIIAGPQPRTFDIPIRAATGPVSEVCRADLDRLAAAMPRLVMGYHRFDQAGFDASMVFELPGSVVGALRKLHAAVPEVTSRVAGHPMFALGVAADPGEVLAWLRTTTRQLHDHPFSCPWFAGLNQANDELAGKLGQPLPPIWQGLRGFAMTIDDASILPPNIAGHVIIAGSRVADLITSLAGTVPAIAGIPLTRDGRPVAIPTQQLHLPTPSAHFALTTDRLVIAAGDGSERRVTEHLASPVPRASPLMVMAFDVPRLQKIMASLGKPVDNLASLGEIGVDVDVGETGLDLDFWGTWPAAPSAQIAAPPAAPPAKP